MRSSIKHALVASVLGASFALQEKSASLNNDQMDVANAAMPKAEDRPLEKMAKLLAVAEVVAAG